MAQKKLVNRLPQMLALALLYHHDRDVRDQTDKIIRQLDADIDESGFETSDSMESALTTLEQFMNDHDERVAKERADLVEAVKVAKEEEENED